jgi:pyridinium-3,5-bisthiocarboxylic acid mononucleotide nickel chelatase
MKRHLHLNCHSGAAGDMILSALVDLGADANRIERMFLDSDIGVKEIRFYEVMRSGIRGLCLDIIVQDNGCDHGIETKTHHHTHGGGHRQGHPVRCGPHRHLKDMLNIVEQCCATPTVKKMAIHTLRLLAEAEGRIHGVSPDKIHFHEISGIDTIIDVLGTCMGLEMLEIESISASPLSVGRGMLHCAHGTFPVPAPATLEIIAGRNIPCREGPLDGEFLTPTGAALLSTMVSNFESMPPLRPERTGYGAGCNDYHGHANLLQATIGRLY